MAFKGWTSAINVASPCCSVSGAVPAMRPLQATYDDASIAFSLRISIDEWLRSKALFIDRGFIDAQNNLLHTLHWDKRQFLSDSSTARVRAHREKMKQHLKRSGNVSGTAPDTDTKTEAELGKDRAWSEKSIDVLGHALPFHARKFIDGALPQARTVNMQETVIAILIKPSHINFLSCTRAGVDDRTFVDVARYAIERKKADFRYVLGTVRGLLEDASVSRRPLHAGGQRSLQAQASEK